MEKLEVLKQNAIKAHSEANEDGKKILSNLFGEGVFSFNLMEAKTFKDVCHIKGINMEDIIPYKNASGSFQKGINAFAIMTFIADSFNGDWIADWNNTNQKKWYPYFEAVSGFRFCDTRYRYNFAFTGVGSRLCYKDEKTAEHVGKTFLSEYKELLIK